jgi:hypothetical protein
MAKPNALQAHGREDVTYTISRERRKAGSGFVQELFG